MLYLNKKTKAFTIAEMLVVLVISSIIITITIMVLNLVQGQIRSIQTIYKTNTEIRLLKRGLWQDFNVHRIYFDNSKSQLLCASEKDTVIYVFHATYVTRNLDTINVNVFEKKVFLGGEEVKNGSIDALEIHLSEEIKNKKLFIFKTNDAAHYINY